MTEGSFVERPDKASLSNGEYETKQWQCKRSGVPVLGKVLEVLALQVARMKIRRYGVERERLSVGREGYRHLSAAS